MKSFMKIESDGIRTTLEINGMKIPAREIEFKQKIDETPTLKVDIEIYAVGILNEKLECDGE